MSCTGCETAGLYGMVDTEVPPHPYFNGASWQPPDPAAQLRLDSDGLFPLEPLEQELSDEQVEALEQATSPAAGQGLQSYTVLHALTSAGPYQAATQQSSALQGYAGAAGTKARASQYQTLLEEQSAGIPEDEQVFPFGWRFTNDAGDSRDPSDPQEIFVVPLNFSIEPENGSCSSASLPDCSSGGSPCAVTLVYVFEIHSVINAPARAKKPDPQEPSTFTPTDPNSVTSNISTTTNASGFYVSTTDPRGAPLTAPTQAYISTSTVELSLTITSTGCGEWGIWKTNFRDWIVQFAGFTKQADSRGNVPDDDMYFGVFCESCKPHVPPGGGGGQGGGKNQNPNSIGN